MFPALLLRKIGCAGAGLRTSLAPVHSSTWLRTWFLERGCRRRHAPPKDVRGCGSSQQNASSAEQRTGVGFFMRTSTGRRVVMLDGFSDRAIFLLAIVQIPESRDVSRSVWRPVRRVNCVGGAAVDRPRGQLTTSVGRRLDGVRVWP